MRDAARGTPVGGIVLGVVVLGLAALGVFLGVGRPRAAATSERAPVAAAEPEQSLDAAPGAIEEANATSNRAPAPPATAPAPAETEADAEPPADELRGRVVDAAGAPLPGAHIALERGIAREFNVLDLEAAHASERIAEATAGARGEFRFVLARGIPVDLVASGTGFVDTLVPDRYAGEYVEVTLTPGFLAHGRITRARDGTPVEGAQVRLFRLGGPSSVAQKTTSGADGRYEVRFTFSERATLEVVSANEQTSDWIDLVVGLDGTVEKDVVLQPGIVVEGRVTDAATGEPIQGAIVGEGWVFRRKAVTNALGEYRLPGFGQPGSAELHAKAQGYGKAKRTSLPGAENGVLHVDFELAPGRAAIGRILDPNGTPIAGAYVAAVSDQTRHEGLQEIGWDWCSGTTDESGRFRIEGISPALRHALLACKHGWSRHVWNFPPRELDERESDLGDLVLTPPALVAGRVEDERGAGLADFWVILQGNNADQDRLVVGQGISRPLVVYFARREVRSDAEGRFWFGGVAAGAYELLAHKQGYAEAGPLTIQVEEGIDQEGLVLRVRGGGSIHGRVIDEEGSPVPKVLLWPEILALDSPAADRTSVGSVESDAEGRFELTGLPEGEYKLNVYPITVQDGDPDAPWLETTIERVHTGAEELVIVLEKGATIGGVLLDAKGEPAFGYAVSAAGDVRTSGWLVTTDVEGHFSLAVPRGATCDLEVRPPRGERSRGDEILLVQPGVGAGTTSLVLQLAK